MWRTKIIPSKASFNLDHRSGIFLLGSCFSTNIGSRLSAAGFQTCENPTGIVFSPAPLAANLIRLIENHAYEVDQLMEYDGQFHSLDHHGSFSQKSAEFTLETINRRFVEAREELKKADVLVITLGSAWTYFFKETGQAVANCHKIPQHRFEKKMLSMAQILDAYEHVLNSLTMFNPGLKVLFTISPVRHWKDGAVENQRSKSRLIDAVHSLAENHKQVSYFPAYELVMDDLRDYRFYEEDMLHPNKLAIDYIWEFFQMTYFDESTRSLTLKIEKKSKMFTHRFSDPEHGRLMYEKTKNEIDALINAAYP
jgi:hypothetical protein